MMPGPESANDRILELRRKIAMIEQENADLRRMIETDPDAGDVIPLFEEPASETTLTEDALRETAGFDIADSDSWAHGETGKESYWKPGLLGELEKLRNQVAKLTREKEELKLFIQMSSKYQDFLEVEMLSRVETALVESEKRFRLISETIPMPIFVNRISDNTIVYANKAAGALFGFPSDSCRNRKIGSFFEKRDLRLMSESLDKQGHVINHELRGKKENGDHFWAALSVQPLTFNEEACLLGALFDLTELRKAENKYRIIFEDAIEGIFQCTPAGRFLNLNPSMARILGYDSPDDALESVSDIGAQVYANQEDRAELIRILNKNDRLAGFETQLFRKDGAKMWASISARTVRNPHGKIDYYEGVLIDITEKKNVERAEREREAAEAANNAKSQFLARMCHEIRTPMNAILGMADLLWESRLTPDQKKYVKIFRNSGESLLALINDILDVSKVEAGEVTFEKIEFNIADVVEKCCEVMAVQAHGKNLELVCHMAQETPVLLVGDPRRLEQILANLLSNAVKFTKEGEIVVEVSSETTMTNPTDNVRTTELQFAVRDTGIGVPVHMREKIFEIFTQTDNSISREYGGTGLGLAICKRYVEMMGGRIGLESELGKGSIFRFSARFDIQPETKTWRDLIPFQIRGIRAIIADDNPVCRLNLSEMLSNHGARTCDVTNADQCVEALVAAEKENDPFRLILLDNRMSAGPTGFQTVLKIRETTGRSDHVVLMLTSHEETDRVAEDAVIAACLVKPVKMRELCETTQKILGGACPARQTVIRKIEPDAKPQRPLRILLVEDNTNNRMLFSFYLKETVHHVEEAENGKIGLEKCVAGKYDIVFMDIEMPVMDGYQATRKIREWETNTGGRIPIIALTAHALVGKEQECLEAGCTAYVTKPFKKSRLLEILETYAFGEIT